MGIGFLIPALWVIVFPGLIFYFIGLKQSSHLWQATLGGFTVWTVKSMLTVVWFWNTYPILWIDLGLGKAELPIIGFYWFSVSVFIGVAGIFCSSLLWSINHYLKGRWFLILTPLVFVVSEVLGSFSFSSFLLGDHVKPNVVFSFGYLGYLLAEHEWLIQLARFGGVYLLTLVVVTGGVFLWHWLEKSNYDKKSLEMALTILVLLSFSSHLGFYKTDYNEVREGKTKVAIIDTKFGGSDYFKLDDRESYRVNQLVEALAAALAQEPDYVVMPEDSRYLSQDLSPTASYAKFRFQQSDPSAVIVEAGPVNLALGGRALRATIYDGVNKKVYATDKQYLVPQGEFMPVFYRETLNVLGYSKVARNINNKLQYRPGPYNSQADMPKIIPGILFCFASADPLGVRRLVEERELPFIAHPISHAWFNNPISMWHQFDLMLKIHALWNQVPIVSAGNMVSGALFNSNGEKITGDLMAEGDRWSVSLVSW